MLQGFEILDCDFVKENKYMKSHWHIKRRASYNEAELRKNVGIIAVVAMCLLALSYIYIWNSKGLSSQSWCYRGSFKRYKRYKG